MSLGPGLAPWLSPQRGLKSGQGMQGARCQVSEPGKATAGTSHAALLPAICSPASPPRMPGPLSWGWLGIFETAFVDKRLLAKKKKSGTQFCKCGKLGDGAGEDGENLLLHQEGSPGR